MERILYSANMGISAVDCCLPCFDTARHKTSNQRICTLWDERIILGMGDEGDTKQGGLQEKGIVKMLSLYYVVLTSVSLLKLIA